MEVGYPVSMCGNRTWIIQREAGKEWEHPLVSLPQTRRHSFVAKPPQMGIMTEALFPAKDWPSDHSLGNCSVRGTAQHISPVSPSRPLRPEPSCFWVGGENSWESSQERGKDWPNPLRGRGSPHPHPVASIGKRGSWETRFQPQSTDHLSLFS